MAYSKTLGQLIKALQCLPGVGAKSAQRMAFTLLERQKNDALTLANALNEAVEKIGHCKKCRNFSEQEYCHICAATNRDVSVICVVETPADVQAIEDATDYKGLYFVLMGRLSPLDGVGPLDIGLDKLAVILDAGEISEIILATNPTVEGEATAHYLSEMTAKRGIKTTRLAHGIPFGGEIEYVNNSTLAMALNGRAEII